MTPQSLDLGPLAVTKLTIFAVNDSSEIIPPRTKKNSPMIVPGSKHPILLPSEQYREWEKAVLTKMTVDRVIVPHTTKVFKKKENRWSWVVRYAWREKAINYTVNCAALIYREMLSGDAVGFYQAIGDCLQKAGIIEDDKLIVSWDGSRLLKDPGRPRIELTFTEVRE